MTGWKLLSKAQRADAVAAQLADGRSYTEAARNLGTSRSAIAGVAMRNPTVKPVIGSAVAEKPARRPSRELPSSPAKLSRKREPSPSIAPELQQTQPIAPTVYRPHGVAFLDAGDFACKAFLPGEPATHRGLVCASPVPVGQAFRFCRACSERLFSSPPKAAPAVNDKSRFRLPKTRCAS